jgi:hypothetical protein
VSQSSGLVEGGNDENGSHGPNPAPTGAGFLVRMLAAGWAPCLPSRVFHPA